MNLCTLALYFEVLIAALVLLTVSVASLVAYHVVIELKGSAILRGTWLSKSAHAPPDDE